MSIEDVKGQARTHEQKEEWGKAVDLYKKAIARLEKDDHPDIGLYNRVADLLVRQGQLDDAAAYYEQSIELYVDAGLPNNAIAVCKKIVRNMPRRHSVYLRMGQIRGRQGFLTEARQNFLTYAERMQSTGKIDEGLRALAELADLAPDDVQIRLAIAVQMQAHGRKDEAITQLRAGYHAAQRRGLSTTSFEERLAQLDATPGPAPAAARDELGGFGDLGLGDEAEPAAAGSAADPLAGFGEIDIDGTSGEEDAPPAALPLLGGELEEDDESEPLPLLGDGFAATRGDAAALAEGRGEAPDAGAFGEREERTGEFAEHRLEMPELESGELSLDTPEEARAGALEEARSEARSDSAAPAAPRPGTPDGLAPRPQRPAGISEKDPMGHEALAARGDVAGAMNALRKLVKASPNDLVLRHRMVEYAERLGDPAARVEELVDLAGTFERLHLNERARSVYQHVLYLDPKNARAQEGLQRPAVAAGDGGFIDLGSLLLDDEEEKTTRFVVAYQEPSGDEQADFAQMLSQFRAKVAENLEADDVKAHQDLGTAYKEMGLVDEAISEFQQALRASANHLPTVELLGQCFMEKGEPEAALRTLRRALDAPREVEDELLGIYYWLGRAHQQLGNKGDAVEFYDRVFSLDINFADVTERLRALR